MLLAEPTFNTRAMREQMVQTIFEDYSCPAVFLAKNAALSSFATGRQTSLVVDAGHEGTVGKPSCLSMQYAAVRKTCRRITAHMPYKNYKEIFDLDSHNEQIQVLIRHTFILQHVSLSLIAQAKNRHPCVATRVHTANYCTLYRTWQNAQ